jgi:hypothetical protein
MKIEKIEQLFPGVAVVYNPDVESENSPSDEDLPLGSIGIFLSRGDSWEKFTPGLEPINILFGDKIIRVYIDEIEFA